MLDITLLRRDLDAVLARLQTRKNPQPFLDADAFRALEAERKTVQTRTEELQATRNRLSKQIGALRGKGEDTSALMAEVAGIGDELKRCADRLGQIQTQLEALVLSVPNLPQVDVPVGTDETGNVEVIPDAMIGNTTLQPGERRLIPQAGTGNLTFDTPAPAETMVAFCRAGGLGAR